MQAIVIFAAIIILVELLARMIPLYSYANPQEYFLYRQGELLQNGEQDFETILFGDSRSMAIAAPTVDRSFYNFSVPGMGARHYPLSLQLYLDSGRLPKTVVLAPLQHILLTGTERPIGDLKYDAHADVTTAAKQLVVERLRRPFLLDNAARTTVPGIQLLKRQAEGAFLSARLHYLGYANSIRLFDGMDAVVQAYQGAPALYRTYFMRNAIRAIHLDSSPAPECNTCEAIYASQCFQETVRQANMRVERYRVTGSGSFNLDNLTTPSGRLALRITRDQAIGDIATLYNAMDAAIDTSILERTVQIAAKNKIRFIYLELPLPRRMAQGRNVNAYREAIQQVLFQYPDTAYYTFPDLVYEEDLFIDPLHLSCAGGMKLNEDWNRLYSSINRQLHSQNEPK